MSLLPDPDELEAVAHRIAARSAALRTHARRIGLAVAHDSWHGPAARAFAVAAIELCRALRRCADRLDDAVDALRRHAGTVRDRLATLRRTAHDIDSVLSDTGQTLQHLAEDPARLGSDGRSLVHDVGTVAGGALHLVGVG